MANLKVKRDDRKSNIPETLIPIETTFTGNIETNTSIRIDGRVKGNVKAKGDVMLGPKALIEGDVFGNSFSLAGTITGNVVAAGIVSILAKSHVLGDITAKAFSIEMGASYSGKCNIGSLESAKLIKSEAINETPPKKPTSAGK